MNFTKVRGKWRANATVNGNYNLHVEGGGASVAVYQKTAADGTRNCLVRDSMQAGDCYDFDFGGYIYPKEIEVVCDEEPSVGIITEGE